MLIPRITDSKKKKKKRSPFHLLNVFTCYIYLISYIVWPQNGSEQRFWLRKEDIEKEKKKNSFVAIDITSFQYHEKKKSSFCIIFFFFFFWCVERITRFGIIIIVVKKCTKKKTCSLIYIVFLWNDIVLPTFKRIMMWYSFKVLHLLDYLMLMLGKKKKNFVSLLSLLPFSLNYDNFIYDIEEFLKDFLIYNSFSLFLFWINDNRNSKILILLSTKSQFFIINLSDNKGYQRCHLNFNTCDVIII